MRRRTKLGLAVIAAAIYCIALAPSALATDHPYTVTFEGVELTEGAFQANGHINWRTTAGTGSMHFDPNNGQPGGTYIGASFYPIPLAPGECIVFVQVHPFNYHFGENQETPACAPSSTPPTSPTPTPDPEPTSTPSPEPSTSETPTPTPTPTNTPQPSSEPTPDPSSTPTPQPTPTPSPTASTPSPSPSTGIGTPEFPPTPTEEPQPTPSPTTSSTTESGSASSPSSATPEHDTLAVTGPSNDSILFGAALAALLFIAGTLIWITREKK